MLHEKTIKILHVDDNEITRYATSKLLRNAGFQVVSADCAKTGMDALIREGPSLVLLDVNLPDMSGYELCRRIKAMPEYALTPILHMSASFVKSTDQVRGLQGGADGYVTEPVDPDVLVATINAVLRVRKAELERAVALRDAEESKVRLKLISDVGHLLAESQSLENAVEQIVGAFVPRFADTAVIALFDENGKSRALASAHIDADRANLLRQALYRYPPNLKRGNGTPVEGMPAKVIAPVTDEWLMSFARDGEHFIMLRGVGAREAVIAAMGARGNKLGVIALAHTTPARSFSKQDVEFIETLANRMAVVIDNTRLLRQAQLQNRMKDEFLVSLAHELRNPLAPIRNATGLMAARMGDPAALEHLRGIIEKQVNHISRIIDDLTDVARIEHGKVTLRRSKVEMGQLVAQTAENCNDLIKAKHQNLNLELLDQSVYVNGDPTRLEQIVCNLIHNAAKYTPQLGSITIRVESREGQCFVQVKDNGMGISPQLLPRIFDLFAQAPQPLDRPEGGLGIGLTIVRHFVSLHGGSISARSEGEGKGSEFTVRLPLAETEISRRQEPSEAPPATAKKTKRVLLIDDSADTRETMQALVESWGHDVKIGSHANVALEILKSWTPDLMLLDIGLPEINGFELARRIRAVPEWKDVRLVALTGYSGERERRMALESGFDEIMIKPVDLEELERMLCR